MFELLSINKSKHKTVFLAINLLDYYLQRKKNPINVERDLYLIAVTCVFLAAKHEEVQPIRLCDLVQQVRENNISNSDIIDMEIEIFETVKFRLIMISPFEFIKTFIFDFKYNNEKTIDQLCLNTDLVTLEKLAIFFAKIMLHEYSFVKYR
jgi:hypothetical protein